MRVSPPFFSGSLPPLTLRRRKSASGREGCESWRLTAGQAAPPTPWGSSVSTPTGCYRIRSMKPWVQTLIAAGRQEGMSVVGLIPMMD